MTAAGSHPRRAVLYARVSTDDQVDGTSLGVQLQRARAWAAVNEYEIAGEYVDEGISGAKESRPQFDRMWAVVRGGGADAVVVSALDRFGRSVAHNSALLAELDRLGVAFVSTTQAFDSSTPMGRAMRHLSSIFAELERDTIRDRMVSGVTAVLADNHWPGGPPPFGYRVVRNGRHSDLALDDDEAETVRILVDCLVDYGMSTLETARHLNGLGRRARQSNRWNSQSVRHQASNGLGWSGEWVYRRPARKGSKSHDPHGAYGPPVTLQVPAIITPERHRMLREVLAVSSTGPIERKNNYLLSGMIVSRCGARMHGVSTRSGLRLMRCAGAHTQIPREERCDCKTVVADTVERMVWDEVVRVLSDPDELQARAEQVLAKIDRSQQGDDVALLKRRASKAEADLAAAFAKGIRLGLDDEALRHATDQFAAELETARRRLSQAEAWAATAADTRSRVERIWDLAASARRQLDTTDIHTRRRFLEVLGVQVRVCELVTCPTCGGAGLISVVPESEPVSGKRERGRVVVQVCPACRRTRTLPVLSITGAIPDASSLGKQPAVEAASYPFSVVAGGAAS